MIYAAGFVVGLGLQQRLHPPALRPPAARAFGSGLTVLGLGTLASAASQLRRAGTAIDPGRPTRALVRSGPYRFTRDPIYGGFALAYAGVSVWSRTTGPLLMLPGVLAVVDRVVVAREERYLERLFGAAYRDYLADTRRWL